MSSDLQKLTSLLLSRRLMVATAESCTAGIVAGLLTDQAGSSRWFERGFVTYSDAAKHDMLGVSPDTLRARGAVSEQTVIEMARGALQRSRAQVSLAVSGVAGPGGGSEQKPVGAVWFAWAHESGCRQAMRCFSGDRKAIRQQAADYAVRGLLETLDSGPVLNQ